MSLQLYVSNNLRGLKDHMVKSMKEQKLGVFDPYYIISQTEGMNIWLKYALANDLTIAANLKFCKPNDILFEVYILLGGAFQVTINRQSYVWIIFDILGSIGFQKRFPNTYQYIVDDAVDEDLKRLQFAEKIADLFDQYQIYRPEFIKDWSQKNEDTVDNWQAYIWMKILSYQQEKDASLQNINTIRDYILEHIDKPEYRANLQNALPTLYLFGLSVFTQYHLEVFYKLAQYIDIHFYLMNPSPFVYWGDDRSEKEMSIWKAKGYPDKGYLIGNELLTSWGKLIQNTLKLLFQNEEIINAYEPINVASSKPNTLLNLVKYEVFENLNNADRLPISEQVLLDNTIQIHSHYTIQREVEGLYNFILHQFESSKGTIEFRDILVVCSDINAYAPYINGVFENGIVPMRYKIADTSLVNSTSRLQILEQLLALKSDQFNLTNIMDILELEWIADNLNIHDNSQVLHIFQQANIKSGIAGQTVDQTYAISWINGIKRIMYGICMSGAPILNDGEQFFEPLDYVEGKDAWSIIRVCDFVLELIKMIQSRSTPRPLNAWMDYVKQIVNQVLIDPDQTINEELSSFNKLLQEYTEVTTFYNETIDYDLFYNNFSKYLAAATQTGTFYNDGITFCTVVPMRSIPFKVIAMLGMDAGKFPRRDQYVSFDLMQHDYRLGDRNIKDGDKHLFLETLLAAEDTLYISYLGKSAKDNTLLNPSTLIDELLDYIQLKVEGDIDVRKVKVVQHPLNNFSSQYNQLDNQLYYYNNAQSSATKRLNLLKDEKFNLDIELSSQWNTFKLAKFISQPIRFFYNNVLGLYLEDTDVDISNYEPFVFESSDGLAKYDLNNRVVQALIEQKDWDDFVLSAQLNSILPLNNVGLLYAEQKKEEWYSLLKVELNISLETLQTNNFSVEVSGKIIEGEILKSGDKAYSIIFSKNYYKHFTATFLNGILAWLNNDIKTTDVLYINQKKKWCKMTMQWHLLDEAFVIDYFNKLFKWLEKSLELPFHLDSTVWEKYQAYLADDAVKEFMDLEQVFDDNKEIDKYIQQYVVQTDKIAIDQSIQFFQDVILPIINLFEQNQEAV